MRKKLWRQNRVQDRPQRTAASHPCCDRKAWTSFPYDSIRRIPSLLAAPHRVPEYSQVLRERPPCCISACAQIQISFPTELREQLRHCEWKYRCRSEEHTSELQ